MRVWNCKKLKGCPVLLIKKVQNADCPNELIGMGYIGNCGCCCLRSRDLHTTISAGDWACVEGHRIWWFQEPLTSTLACGKVHEESEQSSYFTYPLTILLFRVLSRIIILTELKTSHRISCRRSRLTSTSLTIWLLQRLIKHLIWCMMGFASVLSLACMCNLWLIAKSTPKSCVFMLLLWSCCFILFSLFCYDETASYHNLKTLSFS